MTREERIQRHHRRVVQELYPPRAPHPDLKIPTASEVLKVCADVFAVSADDITSDFRFQHLCRPRNVAVCVMRVHARLTYPEIGKSLGQRHESAVVHAFQTLRRTISRGDMLVLRQIREVERRLDMPAILFKRKQTSKADAESDCGVGA